MIDNELFLFEIDSWSEYAQDVFWERVAIMVEAGVDNAEFRAYQDTEILASEDI